jgi:hypothetical protein
MQVLTGLRLRYAVLTVVAPLLLGIVGCGGGDHDPAAIQATKESESKYEQVIKQQSPSGKTAKQ